MALSSSTSNSRWMRKGLRSISRGRTRALILACLDCSWGEEAAEFDASELLLLRSDVRRRATAWTKTSADFVSPW